MSNKIYVNFITEQRLQKLKLFCDKAVIEGLLRRICSENFILLKVLEVDFLIAKPFILWLHTTSKFLSSHVQINTGHTDTVIVYIKKLMLHILRPSQNPYVFLPLIRMYHMTYYKNEIMNSDRILCLVYVI